MSNTTKKPARKRRISTFLANRKTAVQNFQFLRQNKGSLTVHKMDLGSYRAAFASKETGRTAFAYGQNFREAYSNMIRLFNIKYLEL